MAPHDRDPIWIGPTSSGPSLTSAPLPSGAFFWPVGAVPPNFGNVPQRSSFGPVSSWPFIAAQSRKGVAPALGARQGQAKAKGKYKGRAEDTERNAGIAGMIAAGQSWNTIQSATGCSRATIAKIAKRLKVAA